MRTKHAYICVQKDAYIGVQKMHIFAYETRIYMLASEQRVSLAGITNSMPKEFWSESQEKSKEEWWLIVRYCTDINSLRFRPANMHNALLIYLYLFMNCISCIE